MPTKSIIIVGNGAAAWLTASLLQRALDRAHWALTVVEVGDGADGLGLPLGVDYLSPRALEQLSVWGWDEDSLIGQARGTAALGLAYTDWARSGVAFQSFGAAGAPMGPVGFHHMAARLRETGKTVNFANYSLGALCAQAHRFSRPEAGDRSVLSTLTYGLHVSTSALTDVLRRDALARGVHCYPSEMINPTFDARGFVSCVETASGRRIVGDLFIDCTGPKALLSRNAPRLNWSSDLPIDRIAVALSLTGDAPASYADVATHAAGWQRFTAVQDAVEEVFAFEAAAMGADAPADAHQISPGRQVAAWVGNTVAIGGAAAMVDPLMNQQLELAVSAVTTLIELLPATDECAAEARQFSRQIAAEMDSARDIAAAAYQFCGRSEPFWQRCRAHAVPERLAYKISLFQSCGRIALYDDEIYEEAYWVMFFETLGLRAQSYDAQANAPSVAEIEAHFAQVRRVMLDAVGRLPSHESYLRSMTR